MTIDASIPLQVRMPNLSDIYNEAEDRRWQREQRGMQRTQFAQQQDAQAKAAQNAEIGKRVELLGQAAQWADTPEKWDQAVDYLTQQGLDVGQYKGKFTPELRMSAISGAGQMKQHYEQTGDFTLGPGAKRFDATGKLIAEADFAPRPVTLGPGQTAFEYDPNAPKDTGSIWQNMLRTESGGQHFRKDGSVVTSPAGAIGIAQVMPGTAPEAARLANLPFDDKRYRTDPAYNEALGKAYFQKQLETFGGDQEKAVAAYNAGPGNVQKAVARGGANWKDHLPGETKGYLQSVFGGGPRVIGRGDPKKDAAPSGYRWKEDGTLEAIPGGPGDKPQNASGLSKQQYGAIKSKVNNLAVIKGQLARVKAAEDKLQSGGFGGPVWGRIPGAGSLDTESAVYDKALANLNALVRQLTRTPGEGAMSDYESKLASAIPPSRSDSREARAEAIAGIEDLINNLEQGYGEMLGQQGAAGPAPVNSDDALIKKYLNGGS